MKLMKKVSIILVLIMVFSFCVPGVVRAEVSWTGKLTEPIVDLVVWIGDGAMDLIHGIIFGQETSVVRIDLTSSGGEIFLTILGAVAGAIVAVALLALGGWLVAGAAAAIAGVTLTAVSVGTVLTVATVGGVVGAVVAYSAYPDDKIALPVYTISAEELFSNEIALFDVDFFNPSEKQTITTALGEDVEIESTAFNLRENIATWYIKLRDIAIVALLCILVYTGIRILLSSVSSDKAKYKQMIIDWVVALCLIFVMHYIMSFANIIVDKVTELVKTSVNQGYYLVTVPYDDKILEGLKDATGNDSLDKDSLGVTEDANGDEYFIWETNLMGNIRMRITTN